MSYIIQREAGIYYPKVDEMSQQPLCQIGPLHLLSRLFLVSVLLCLLLINQETLVSMVAGHNEVVDWCGTTGHLVK